MNNKEDLRKFTVVLSRSKGFGPVSFQTLYMKLGSINKVYDFVLNNEYPKLTLDKDFLLDPIFSILQDSAIKYKCYWEDDYPEMLKNIPDAPIVIYYKGEWLSEIFNQCIAIVGTRKVSFYGKKVTKNLTADLSEYGFTIVSGMALGVDREAHEECLNNGGKTIAVLGTSVDKPSPYSNIDIYKRILDNGGLVISEFAPDIKFTPALFASRNRIIAGLAKGTVVTEAGEGSGALITAELALEYNREVLCVPGNIDNPYSMGVNKLIKEGRAKLVQSVEDILAEFNIHNVTQSKDMPVNLNKTESLIYNGLLTGPKFLEDLLDHNISKTEILANISLLELKGFVFKNDQGMYSIN